MTEHSKGPWQAEVDFKAHSSIVIFDANGDCVAYTPIWMGLPNSEAKELAKANARLVAAAPELLAALDAFLSITSYCGKEHCTAEQCVAALNAIKALSKARGES
jgi:hypothetical protein